MLTRADLAKYPFLNEASDYIKELGISIDDLASPDFSPVLERAEKRLEEALSKGRVSNEFGNENAEILSFPVSNLSLASQGRRGHREGSRSLKRRELTSFSDRKALKSSITSPEQP